MPDPVDEFVETQEHPPVDERPAPAPVTEPEDLRKTVAELNAKMGKLIEDNVTLRGRLDARELEPAYAPARTDGPAADVTHPNALETYLRDALDPEERDAPWTGTVLKVVDKLRPIFNQAARDAAAGVTRAAQVDDEYYAFLAERWGQPPTVKNLRSIARKYGKDIGELSNQLCLDSRGRTKPEYQRDYTAAFEPVAQALEERFSIAAQDIRPRREQERAATGDRGSAGGGGRSTTTRPRETKQGRIDDFVKEVTGT